jgi:hypothetical protein
MNLTGAQNDIFEEAASSGNGGSNAPSASSPPVSHAHVSSSNSPPHTHRPRPSTSAFPKSSTPETPNDPSTSNAPTVLDTPSRTPHNSSNCPSSSKRSKLPLRDVHKRSVHKSRINPQSW